MPFTNNNMLTIACASSQPTAPNECKDECDGISGDASFESEFDFRAEYASSESESESECASTSRSESPDILHEPHYGSMTGQHQHLHYDRSHELAPHAPSQAPSSAHARPSIRTRSFTLPAPTSAPTESRAASQSAPAPASAAPPPPPPPPTGAVARTTDAQPVPKRSIYKRRHSYDLRYDFLHAAPAARAALARFHRQIFHAPPPPPPSQPPAQAAPPMSAPHLAALDAAAQGRIQGG